MRTSRARLLVPALLLAVTGSSCAWAAGEAQAERFEEWYAAHPVDDVELEQVEGEDVVPVIGGAAEVRARLTTSDPDVPDLTRAMRELCRFEEVADSGVQVTYVLLVDVAEVEFPCRARGDLRSAVLWEQLPRGEGVEQVTVGAEEATMVTDDAHVVAATRTLVGALAGTDRWPDLGVAVTAERAGVRLGSAAEVPVLTQVEHALDLPARDRVVSVRADDGRTAVTSDLGPEQLRRLDRELRAHARAEGGGPIEVLPGKVRTLAGYATSGLPPAVRGLADELSRRARVTGVRLGADRVELVTATVPDARGLVGELVQDPRARGVGRLVVEVDGMAGEVGQRTCRTGLASSDGAAAAAYVLLDLCDVPGVTMVDDAAVLEVVHEAPDLAPLVAQLRRLPQGRAVTLLVLDDSADGRSTVRFAVADRPRFEPAGGDEALARAMAAAWD
ncbi:hypothetical protein [Marmoricola sp. Leaf446]|uniref:hypothetical protein n=1 Tax=Marmoricola sp. Leaf446 TaxID=1736379 RepID=UPI0012E3BCA4|nr:hypothetical protein [Marmoricola sp. Leaf446]